MSDPAISECRARAFTLPTDCPESDGTLRWDSTTMVLVELAAGDHQGVGYTYSSVAAAAIVEHHLRPVLIDESPLNIPKLYGGMVSAIRNLGRPGIASMAISAVDLALWDLKAKILETPMARLLGKYRDGTPVYGSGGFTSYTDQRLREQTTGWVEAGIPRVKIKVGREPERDPARVQMARDAIGDAQLFVDANGGFARKQALAMMNHFSEAGVTWFEEPVSSSDPQGLRLIRNACVPGIEITAGEYGFSPRDFLELLQAGAVDVLQADATRCGGVTGFLQAAALSDAFQIPLSSHCAPSLHMHLGCAVPGMRHAEFFYDHIRIERMLLDGFVEQHQGVMTPDLERPGWGWEFKHKDANQYAVK